MEHALLWSNGPSASVFARCWIKGSRYVPLPFSPEAAYKVSNMLITHFTSVPVALLAASAPISASPLRSRTEYAVKDTHNVPSKWHQVGPAPANKVLHLHISLKQSQFDELERHLYEGILTLFIPGYDDIS